MARAEIKTNSGAKIFVEGSTKEVADIIARLENREETHNTKEPVEEKKHKKVGGKARSLAELILRFKEEGFFNKPRKISDVKSALDQQAYFYPLPSISTALIRRVRRNELGRVKMEGNWVYVKR